MGLLLLRIFLWVVLPLSLVVLAIGPSRVRRWLDQFWSWLRMKRLEPDAILAQVVKQHEKHIAALRAALAGAETARRDIEQSLRQSNENIAGFEADAKTQVARGGDPAARAALYQMTLERTAAQNFQQQLDRQVQHIADAKQRLHLLELQLRQYEVGRSILLSQLAEAQTVEQQYAIASRFDPFNAIAEWEKAEGMVQERAISARAVERVCADIADIPLAGQPARVDPTALDKQLADLKAQQVGANKPAAESERNGRGG
jgi:phage shock protein A